ncbi:energy transducer TonB [Mucilaginibacter myungsuensis]|uniref:Energy transducer TonB n=1 Tax=Mucilaginibacter myungsuensis TaxID=649104 RepID=A0A929PXW1_9SPHI|nr:energy transducer TonB [Mucilaginibacter myungsuensis]MBE9663591.1 energy transducer TonB [Mucilaginibacter myungsuensis]MDN3599085.1 energy transducer TonB [Mucilaginibacter myungsuensis]
MDYQKTENNYPKAFLATGLIMAVLMAACYFIVFRTPQEHIDGMGGILVNYGTTEEGSGSDYTSTEEPSVAENANKQQPDEVTPEPPTEKPTVTDNTEEDVVTQNTEDAPEVAVKKNNKPVTPATNTTKPDKTTAKPTINANALYKGPTNNGTGTGDGTTGKPGNQGDPEGSTLANNYGQGGSGNGLSLSNWKFVQQPDVKNVNRVPGTVVIDFEIDENGNVLYARANKSMTKAGLDLVQACEAAIKNSRFSSSAKVNGNSKGRMSFVFKVD